MRGAAQAGGAERAGGHGGAEDVAHTRKTAAPAQRRPAAAQACAAAAGNQAAAFCAVFGASTTSRRVRQLSVKLGSAAAGVAVALRAQHDLEQPDRSARVRGEEQCAEARDRLGRVVQERPEALDDDHVRRGNLNIVAGAGALAGLRVAARQRVPRAGARAADLALGGLELARGAKRADAARAFVAGIALLHAGPAEHVRAM